MQKFNNLAERLIRLLFISEILILRTFSGNAGLRIRSNAARSAIQYPDLEPALLKGRGQPLRSSRDLPVCHPYQGAESNLSFELAASGSVSPSG